MEIRLPKPRCRYGYTEEQIGEIMSAPQYREFKNWMFGQTQAICNGFEWSEAIKQEIETGCGPHGTITYGQDVVRFLAGLPVID